MNWSSTTRQVHRWLSIAFTVGFVINAVAWSQPARPAAWVPFLAVGPLILLLLTGLYLFVLPYAVRWRTRPGASA